MSSVQVRQVVLSGDLTVRTAKRIHSELLEALQHCEHLQIDCSEATDLDISFLQLMIAARKSADRDGKTISFHFKTGEAVHSALLRAGLHAANFAPAN